MKRICVFGGQFGSEGKGSFAEYVAKESRKFGRHLIVAGDNSPNSGHTNSVWKSRQIPSSSCYADAVILGPDSVIDQGALSNDMRNLATACDKLKRPIPPVYIHSHAAIIGSGDALCENDVVTSIGSTGTGTGQARKGKFIDRIPSRVIGDRRLFGPAIVVRRDQWAGFIEERVDADWVFECGQGVMLDTNLGYYPYCTSRSTLPRVAVERNGFGMIDWLYAGVYRTYPIRTGGNSGPTGARETFFESIGQENEIATVTGRIRRIFEFSTKDFLYSTYMSRPDMLVFTHLDYVGIKSPDSRLVEEWMANEGILNEMGGYEKYGSYKTGEFFSITT